MQTPQSDIKDLIYGEGFQRQKKINKSNQYSCNKKDIFTVKYDQDDSMIATGLSNGDISLFNVNTQKQMHTLKGSTIEEETPTTCLRWRPTNNNTKQVLVSANSDGSVIHWHATSGKRLHKILENGNSVLALDFNFDGSLFATGGKDFHIRVYDDDIKSIYHTFKPADWSQKGHSNRIFSLKFLPDQPNIMLSGGWDANLLIWDVREKQCVGQFYGPSISGDSIDYSINKGLILTGSYRTEQQIQLWDFRTRKLLKEVKWMGKEDDKNKQIYVYSNQFSKFNDDYILAGCSGLHEVKLFDMNRDQQPCASIIQLDKGVYSVDFANTQNKFIFAGAEGICYEIQIE